ncbi:MAG: hypothetical protein M1821_006053 [Bathelium mastoideum]|nr:MAG: hypothetical protein M1821_006053 [Bathelium mastoideum]KAI9688414.1 MAG: hypothetical protein M1822_001363 [Bathelium mastoideum]
MGLSAKSRAGPGYVILNVIRVMNIIALLAVACASVVMLVKTFIVSKFFFFDACSHVITTSVSLFLICSEISLFRSYFARNWPLLSPAHGFVALGFAMIVLGINILGNLNKQATSQQSLGLAFWRIVIGSGIIVFIIGFLNILASYIFCDSSQGITSRMVRADGATAADEQKSGSPSMVNVYPSRTPVISSPLKSPLKSPFKTFSPFKAMRRSSTLPSYYSGSASDHSPQKPQIERRQSTGPKMPIKISGPLNVNHNFTHLVKPEPAHPADRNSQSQYSDSGSAEPYHWRI